MLAPFASFPLTYCFCSIHAHFVRKANKGARSAVTFHTLFWKGGLPSRLRFKVASFMTENCHVWF